MFITLASIGMTVTVTLIAILALFSFVVFNTISQMSSIRSTWPAFVIVVIVLLISSAMILDQSKFDEKLHIEEGYRQGQIDYMNGNIKYKAAPSTQNVEK